MVSYQRAVAQPFSESLTLNLSFSVLLLELEDMPVAMVGRKGPPLSQAMNLPNCGVELVRNVCRGHSADVGEIQQVGLDTEQNCGMRHQVFSFLGSDLGEPSDPVDRGIWRSLGLNLSQNASMAPL